MLARPLAACYTFVKAAKTVPSLRSVSIQPILPPRSAQLREVFLLPFETVWTRLGLPKIESSHKWITKARTDFEKDCRRLSDVRAEIQLASYYQARIDSPEERSKFPFIGCSKKACFQCQILLGALDLNIHTRGCHGTISRGWTIPEDGVTSFEKTLEMTAAVMKEKIIELLRNPDRRVAQQKQSTAGVSETTDVEIEMSNARYRESYTQRQALLRAEIETL